MAARPKTLFAAIAPVMIGTSMATADNTFHALSAAVALFAALLIQIGTNFANDYFDFKSGADKGERLGPLRVTQAGLVAPAVMKRAIYIVFSLAILAGVYLVFRGGWPILLIGLSSVLFGLLYTGGPYPLGYNGLGDLFVLIFFGPVAVGGTYYVQALSITYESILIGFAPGLFSVAILAVNNLRDIDGDKIAGKKTLAVRFGRRFAKLEYTMCIVVGSLLPLILVLNHPDRFASLASLTVLSFAIKPIQTVFSSQDGPELNTVLATTGKILLYFAILFSIGWLL